MPSLNAWTLVSLLITASDELNEGTQRRLNTAVCVQPNPCKSSWYYRNDIPRNTSVLLLLIAKPSLNRRSHMRAARPAANLSCSNKALRPVENPRPEDFRPLLLRPRQSP